MEEPAKKKQVSYHSAVNITSDAGPPHTVSPDHDVDEIHVKSFFSLSERKIRYFM